MYLERISVKIMKRRIISVFSLSVFILMASLFIGTNVSNANPANSKDLSKEKVAISFIQSVYSDFRTVKDNKEFNIAIENKVPVNSKYFRQLLKDRKYIREQDNITFNSKEILTKDEYEKPKVIFKKGNSVALLIKANYEYKEKPVFGPDINKEEITSGIQVFYRVDMIKKNGVWKIEYIQSDDLTAGIMFPDIILDGTKWLKSIEKGSQALQIKEKYDVKEIIKTRKECAKESKDVNSKIDEIIKIIRKVFS